jgi:hypothetical protein
MNEDRGPDPQPPGDQVRAREQPQASDDAQDSGSPLPFGIREHEPRPAAEGDHEPDRPPASGDGGRGSDPQPAEDDITWLIYLAIGLVAFLALVVLSGMHSAMGH